MQSIKRSKLNDIYFTFCFNLHAVSTLFNIHFHFFIKIETNYNDELMILSFNKILESHEQCQMEGMHYKMCWTQLAVFYCTLHIAWRTRRGRV